MEILANFGKFPFPKKWTHTSQSNKGGVALAFTLKKK
jgi:hypothetical protein